MKNSKSVIYTQDSILDGLKTNNDKVVRYIYKKYLPIIKALVLKNSGNTEDAEDIFQDAMIIILNKAKLNELVLTCTFSSFLYSICWHLWLQILNKKKQTFVTMKIDDLNYFEVAPAESSFMVDYEPELCKIINSQFIRLDNRSQQLLTLYSTDITNVKLAEIKLKSYNEQLKNYAAYNDNVREEERMNLARNIHDILGSSLAGLKMELAVAKQIILNDFQKISPEFEAQMNNMTMQINDSVGLMRRLVRELRPGILDELGITEAIRWQAGETENRSGIKFSLMITPEEFRMDSIQSGIIFRIFQEILTNIVIHSRATHVKVWLRMNDEAFKMKVTDNGIGANKTDLNKADSFGVMGMRERALLLNGNLCISGKTNIGTIVNLSVPIE